MTKPTFAASFLKPTPPHSNSRRSFLRKAGTGLAAGTLLFAATACDDDDDPITMDGTVDLGSGDLGILNYAYALEQLEAAFYAQVLTGDYFARANDEEKQLMEDLEAHERAHREFFEAAISTVGEPIPGLEVNFDAIDFNDRNSVLTTAQTFEDLGVSAYNGAGRLLTNVDFLLIAGKIVSVEARHAAAIRDINLGTPTAFADSSVVDSNGLDVARTPAQVLQLAAPFITTRIDGSNLPG